MRFLFLAFIFVVLALPLVVADGYLTIQYSNFSSANRRGGTTGNGWANITTAQNCGNWNNGTNNFDPKCAQSAGGYNALNASSVDTHGFICVDASDMDICTAGNGAKTSASRDDSALLIQDVDAYGTSNQGLFYNWSNANVTPGQIIAWINFSIATFGGHLEQNESCNISLFDSGGEKRIWQVSNNSKNTTAQGYLYRQQQPPANNFTNFTFNNNCKNGVDCAGNLSIKLSMTGNDNNDFCFFDEFNLTVYTVNSSMMVAFASPTQPNGTMTTNTTVNINFTANTTKPANCTLMWDGVNETLSNVTDVTLGITYCSGTKTATAGTHTFWGFINQTLGVEGTTGNQTIIILPLIEVTNATPTEAWVNSSKSIDSDLSEYAFYDCGVAQTNKQANLTVNFPKDYDSSIAYYNITVSANITNNFLGAFGELSVQLYNKSTSSFSQIFNVTATTATNYSVLVNATDCLNSTNSTCSIKFLAQGIGLGACALTPELVKLYEVNITPATVASNSCTWSGSGDWHILLSDNCVITTNTDIGANSLIIDAILMSGALNMDGGIISAHNIYKNIPTGSQVNRKNGGALRVK